MVLRQPIVACLSVAMQRPAFVDFVDPQCARHNIKKEKFAFASLICNRV
jgi:hypothetical protein